MHYVLINRETKECLIYAVKKDLASILGIDYRTLVKKAKNGEIINGKFAVYIAEYVKSNSRKRKMYLGSGKTTFF